MQLLDFSAYLLKVSKIIFLYKSTIYKKLEDRVIPSGKSNEVQNTPRTTRIIGGKEAEAYPWIASVGCVPRTVFF
jgi:hypothetical protein